MNCEQYITNIGKCDSFEECNIQSIPNRYGYSRHISPGKFLIHKEKYNEFLEYYSKDIEENQMFHLAEKVPNICPIIIDIDFKIKNEKRVYDSEFIIKLIWCYDEVIKQYLDIENIDTSCFIFEKKKPTDTKKNGIYKDGLHLMYPHIITRIDIQRKIREEVIRKVENIGLFNFKYENTINDIFDDKIYKTCWMLYGSMKGTIDGFSCYELSNIHKNGELIKKELSKTDIIKLCSIRNKEDLEASSKISVIEEEYEIPERSSYKDSDIYTYDIIEKLINLLSSNRADDYESWINVGICLKSINKEYFSLWERFSKTSNKYSDNHPGELLRRWNGFENRDKWHISSLKYWAKIDSPEEYKELEKTTLRNPLIESLSCTHHDIAKVVYEILGNQFVCASSHLDIWYIFENHRWKKLDDTVTFIKKITEYVIPKYVDLCDYYKEESFGKTETEQKEYNEMIKKVQKVINKLKDKNFKSNIKDECKEFFYDGNLRFHEELDKDINLVCFNNGVLDLNTFEFRDGEPRDMISRYIPVNYKPKEINTKHSKWIDNYFNQLFPDEEVKQYILMFLSTCLSGELLQRFHIFTGDGENGKSRLMEFLERFFGKHEDHHIGASVPVTFLTRLKKEADVANPTLAKLVGKRFVNLQEPEKSEKLQASNIKSLSGGDTQQARKLFRDPFNFTPQFELILCCNDVPDILSGDWGTWRRIRVVKFKSQFKDFPDINNKYEYQKDIKLADMLFHIHTLEAFACLLVSNYRKFVKQGKKLLDPPAVKKDSEEYKMKNDRIGKFVNECIRENNSKNLTMKIAYPFFKSWYKNEFERDNLPKSDELKEYIIKKFKINLKPRIGFEGLELIEDD